MADIFSRLYWPLSRFPLFEDEDWPTFTETTKGGLSVSEDKDFVYVKADVPGIEPEQVDVTYKKGILTIKAVKEEKEEDKGKTFYRHSKKDFFYQITVPGNIDESREPESTYKNGVVTLKFAKTMEEAPKKIAVKRA